MISSFLVYHCYIRCLLYFLFRGLISWLRVRMVSRSVCKCDFHQSWTCLCPHSEHGISGTVWAAEDSGDWLFRPGDASQTPRERPALRHEDPQQAEGTPDRNWTTQDLTKETQPFQNQSNRGNFYANFNLMTKNLKGLLNRRRTFLREFQTAENNFKGVLNW